MRDQKGPQRGKPELPNQIMERIIARGLAQESPSEVFTPRIRATFSQKALLGNFRALSEQVPEHSLIPMIKANAYGHGAVWAAKTLVSEPKLYGFGVATLEEGQEVRAALGARHRKLPVLVFSGALPWSEEKGHFCAAHGLTPVIAADSDWKLFFKQGWAEKIPYELEFNTGMNRLGMSLAVIPSVLKDLRTLSGEHHPQGIMSHFAQAEKADGELSRLQIDGFKTLRSQFSGATPAAQFHLANSSGIWNRKYFDLDSLTDVVRPGISLYGVPPWVGAPVRGLAPVMTLEAQVLSVRKLKRGDQVGYGGTYKVTGNDPAYIAILGAGYADGIPRRLSNKGYAWLGARAERFLGVVSMDLSAVSCTGATREGEWAEILGPHVDIWAQAQAAETIPYELLTSLSIRVQREYS